VVFGPDGRWRFRDDRCVERRVLRQDLGLQPAQFGSRVEPELLAEDLTSLLEGPQGIRLAPCPIQGDHEQPSEPLAQRMRGDDRFQLDDHVLVTTESKRGVEPLLDHGEAQLGQSADRRQREVLIGEVGKGVAAPQRVRLGQQLDRDRRVAGGGRGPPVGNHLLEAVHVDGFGRQFELVTAVTHGDDFGRPERAPQLRHERLEAVAHPQWRILAPQGVDELICGNHSTHLESQHREQRALLCPRDRDVSSVVIEHLQCTKEPDAHGPTLLRFVSVRSGPDQQSSAVCDHDHAKKATMNAITHALLATMAADEGDTAAAEVHISTAQQQSRTTDRRGRQVVEIASLVVAGDRTRAAGLALIHADEFPDDGELLTRMTGASAAET
jgi:hypothetical protein